MVTYKIVNSEGMYSEGREYPKFSKDGKVWSDIGHLKEHMMYVLKDVQKYAGCKIVCMDTNTGNMSIIPIVRAFDRIGDRFVFKAGTGLTPQFTTQPQVNIGKKEDIDRVLRIMLRDHNTLWAASNIVLNSYIFDEPIFDITARTVTINVTNPDGETYRTQIRFTYDNKVKCDCSCPATTFRSLTQWCKHTLAALRFYQSFF